MIPQHIARQHVKYCQRCKSALCSILLFLAGKWSTASLWPPQQESAASRQAASGNLFMVAWQGHLLHVLGQLQRLFNHYVVLLIRLERGHQPSGPHSEAAHHSTSSHPQFVSMLVVRSCCFGGKSLTRGPWTPEQGSTADRQVSPIPGSLLLPFPLQGSSLPDQSCTIAPLQSLPHPGCLPANEDLASLGGKGRITPLDPTAREYSRQSGCSIQPTQALSTFPRCIPHSLSIMHGSFKRPGQGHEIMLIWWEWRADPSRTPQYGNMTHTSPSYCDCYSLLLAGSATAADAKRSPIDGIRADFITTKLLSSVQDSIGNTEPAWCHSILPEPKEDSAWFDDSQC